MYRKKPDAKDNPEKRGGTAPVESEEAKVQAQRELVTLAAFYNSPSDIPFSPKEPDETAEDAKAAEPPTDIPLPDEIRTRLGIPTAPIIPVSQPAAPQTTDLSSLLSAFQQPPQQQLQPSNLPQDLFSTLQAFMPQQAPQMAAPQYPVDLTSLLSAISAGNQQTSQQHMQQPQPNFIQQQMQQQGGQMPNTAITELLAKLAGSIPAGTPQGFPGIPGFPGIMPQQQQQQAQQQQPPTAPRAWNGVYDGQMGNQANYDNQRDERNSSRDVRRELRDAVGWSDNDVKETAAVGGPAGNVGGGAGGKWAGKHNKKVSRYWS